MSLDQYQPYKTEYRYKENGFDLVEVFRDKHEFIKIINKYIELGFKLHGKPRYIVSSKSMGPEYYIQAVYKEVK